MQPRFPTALAAALTQVVIALALIHASACSTTATIQKPTVNDEAAQRAALVRELNALVAQGPLHFETDTDVLTDESQILLQRIAAQMFRVPRVRVVVSGNADERGETEYNLALGERRGIAALAYLVHLGIPKERVRVISLGEEQPLLDGHNEDAWAMNRRDEFTFLLPGENRAAFNMRLDTMDFSKESLVATTTFTAE